MNRPSPEQTVAYPLLFRVLLVLMAVPQAATGLWAILAPRSWYDSFPGLGLVWVEPTGPYNEHFITDLGAALTALALLVLVAAVSLRRILVQAALVAWLVFALPHFISHIFLTGGLSTAEYVSNLVTVAIAAVQPLLLLALTFVERPAAAPAPGGRTAPAAGQRER